MGLTLIEVMASIALLATLLVGILMSISRHADQIERSQRRTDAIHAADEMLARWMREESGPPRRGRGRVPGQSEWEWTIEPCQAQPTRDFGIELVRLEIHDREPVPMARGQRLVPRPPLVQLDVVRLDEHWPPPREVQTERR